MIGNCSHCGVEEIEVKTYHFVPDPPHDLCVYCENTGEWERRNELTAVMARFMHVLERRLR